MKTIFVGGSRHIKTLPISIKERLDKVIQNDSDVILGDANGADKAAQQYLLQHSYQKVTVFCSGETARNNLGNWPTHKIQPQKGVKGFQFYAAKDREMALRADFGLMIWDGKSPGTILNVLRLLLAGKIAVLFRVPDSRTVNFRVSADWLDFLSQCDPNLIADLKERATSAEWKLVPEQRSAKIPTDKEALPLFPPETPNVDRELEIANAALKSADVETFLSALSDLAKTRHFGTFKRSDTSTNTSGRATVRGKTGASLLKMMAAAGVRLEIAHEMTTASSKT